VLLVITGWDHQGADGQGDATAVRNDPLKPVTTQENLVHLIG
jgi:hypothetical protein